MSGSETTLLLERDTKSDWKGGFRAGKLFPAASGGAKKREHGGERHHPDDIEPGGKDSGL